MSKKASDTATSDMCPYYQETFGCYPACYCNDATYKSLIDESIKASEDGLKAMGIKDCSLTCGDKGGRRTLTGTERILAGVTIERRTISTCFEGTARGPRISMWCGKVNLHFDVASGTWKSDPSKSNGCNDNKLEYCKKWYPETKSIKLLEKERNFFCNANVDPTKCSNWSNKDVYACISTVTPRATPIVTPTPTEDEIVVITQTLSITGVTAAEVCTSTGKRLIEAVIAEVLDVDTNSVQVSKCIDTTSRRSRRLLASGIDLEYQVSLPAGEATAKKQSEIVGKMATMEGESDATTLVVAAVAKAAGKDIGVVTVKGSAPVVTVEKAEDGSGLSRLNAANTLSSVSWSVVATLVGLIALM